MVNIIDNMTLPDNFLDKTMDKLLVLLFSL